MSTYFLQHLIFLTINQKTIFKRNLKQDYERILKLIRYQSTDTADWLDQSQIVTELLGKKP